ncbi:helix-hairpin-helix domain-containing protein [Asanoa sp. NPDC049573]|uniref:ComEA family DNA-binding protein n=1 Tax=Asanoa sp. NPDC049573 TaxID=3155396 RepID=UPI0034445695
MSNDPKPKVARSPEPAPRGFGWRLLHSLWLLLPIVGFGCLGALPFVYLGIRMRRRSLRIAGFTYLVISAASFVTVGSVDETTALSDWAVGVFLVTWLVSIVHAFTVNVSWLRFEAGVRPHHGVRLAPPPGYDDLHRPPSSAATLDVNSATAEQFATLPFFDRARAEAAVTQRARAGGFTDVYAFSDALGLQPHEYVKIFPLVVATPRASAPPPRPAPEQGGHSGRIVDV